MLFKFIRLFEDEPDKKNLYGFTIVFFIDSLYL